jgi:hypothetical protein
VDLRPRLFECGPVRVRHLFQEALVSSHCTLSGTTVHRP